MTFPLFVDALLQVASLKTASKDTHLEVLIHDFVNPYLDLRKNSTFPHGGAGLGFDRLVNFCCLMDGNIRDVVPFPVSYEECEY